ISGRVSGSGQAAHMKKLTPNLIVSRIETCLPFWIDRLGFEKTIEAPEGNEIGFVILRKGNVELMLQSVRSVENDVPPIAPGPHPAGRYMERDALARIRTALQGWPEIVPERTTPYGAREIIVSDPAGNVVFFATHA